MPVFGIKSALNLENRKNKYYAGGLMHENFKLPLTGQKKKKKRAWHYIRN